MKRMMMSGMGLGLMLGTQALAVDIQEGHADFLAEGTDWYCYQELADGMQQAERDAQAAAEKTCAAGVRRISPWRYTTYERGCEVNVSAWFHCPPAQP